MAIAVLVVRKVRQRGALLYAELTHRAFDLLPDFRSVLASSCV
jgi:hypothetical protein